AADPYRLVASNKAHARILWDCSWSSDDSMFATGSRDKTIKIWKKTGTGAGAGAGKEKSAWTAIATLKLPEAVTAVEFAPAILSTTSDCNIHVLAAGLEDGRIFLFKATFTDPANWSFV